jgi:hypothetical protein
MHHRVSPPGTAKGRRAWLFFSLLIPALASKVSTQSAASPITLDDGSPLVPSETSRPYLAVLGPPSLRFEEAQPPPDLSARPPGGAPPKPAVRPIGADVIPAPVVQPKVVVSIPAAPQPAKVEVIAAPKPPPPPSILHDDVRPQVRPEDFLPYFQYPGAESQASNSNNPPPSTATYTQEQ